MIIQQKSVFSFSWNSDSVVGTVYRCKANDKEQIFFAGFIFPDKTEDAAVSVIGIDPLEAIPVIVSPKGRIFSV